MELDDNILDEQVLALKSIYIEAEISREGISTVVELPVPKAVTFKKILNEKTLETVEAKSVEGIHFTSGFPVNKQNFQVESSWLDSDLLNNIHTDISDLIDTSTWEDVNYIIFDYLYSDLPDKYSKDIFKEYISYDKSEFERFKMMTIRAREKHFKGSRFTCSLCLEGNDGINGLQLPCDHAFCKPCFLEYCTKMIEIDDVTRLQCPNCPYEKLPNRLSELSSPEVKKILFERKISKSILESILPQDLFDKYESFRTGLLFSKYQELFPHSSSVCPRCSNWLFRDDVDEQFMHCIHCSFAYCFDCHASWHGKFNLCGSKKSMVPIGVIQEIIGTPDDLALKRNYQTRYGKKTLELAVKDYEAEKLFQEAVENDKDLVKCPTCKIVITKSDGCNKMTCERCSTSFCYLCGDQLDKGYPYGHYNDIGNPCYGKLFDGMNIDGEEFRAPGFIPFA